jgi:soluble lytic murein transglycosylase
MLAAYNAGRGNVKEWMGQYGWTMAFNDIEQIPFPETREFINEVLYNKKRYQELHGR